MANEKVSLEGQNKVKDNADKFEVFDKFKNPEGCFEWQDNGKWDYLKN